MANGEEDDGDNDGPYRVTYGSPYFLGQPYDLDEEREKTRKALAVVLTLLLFIVALSLIFLTAFNALTIEEAKDLAATVLSPVIAVTGTALGFYFGGTRSGKS